MNFKIISKTNNVLCRALADNAVIIILTPQSIDRYVAAVGIAPASLTGGNCLYVLH